MLLRNEANDISSVVFNLLGLGDHLQTLTLGRGPPLKIVPWKIGLLVCLYP